MLNDMNTSLLLCVLFVFLFLLLAAAIGRILRLKEQLEIEFMRQSAMVDTLRAVRQKSRDAMRRELADRNHREHMLQEKLKQQKERYEAKIRELSVRLEVAEKAANENWPKPKQVG